MVSFKEVACQKFNSIHPVFQQLAVFSSVVVTACLPGNDITFDRQIKALCSCATKHG